MSIHRLSWSLAAATLCLAAAGGAQAQITIKGSVLSNVSCFGGTNGMVQAFASGGAYPYTYRWSPSGGTTNTATELSAGNYTFTVTDNSKSTETKSFTVTQPSVLQTTTQAQTNVSGIGKSNGSATVGASGGVSPYTYVWSPSGGTGATASNLTAGAYTVVVKDKNGCSTSQGFTIAEAAAAPAPTITSVSVPANGTYTPGQTLTFTVNFSEPVEVNTSGGVPRIPLTVGSVIRYATYQSGTGTSSLTFQYTVQSGDVDNDGIVLGLPGLNGGTIRNSSADAVLTPSNVGDTTGVRVAAPPPAPVPTLSEWAMILLTGLLALFGAARLGLLPARKT